MQNALFDELQRSESITPGERAKLCNSLLHRIRVIQGHTNLNYTEPHFVESKDSIKHTKAIISSIKDVVRRGCSDVLRSAREHTRVSSDTNSSVTGNEKSIKKRQLKSLLRDSDKSAYKEETKTELKKVCNVRNVLFEAGERPDLISTSRLSQPISKESEKGMRIVTDIVGEGKMAKKRRRRKRKMDEIEITSSMTIAQSKVNMPQFIQGDSRPVRLKPRKNRDRYLNRKRPECSGDESDIEDASSQTNDISQARPKFPRRRFRPKYPQMRASSSALTQQEKEIRDMVSSTIDKLNNVNNHVKKVIEDSLSSEASFAMETSLIATPRRILTSAEVTSNWSTATMSKATLVDVSEISKSVSLQTQESDKKHSETQATIVTSPAVKEDTSLQTLPPPPPTARSDASNVGEEVISPRSKRTKHKNDALKLEKEMTEVVPVKETPKKKKTSASKPADLAEPVSSLKKNSKKKKDKRKEHVNFVTSPPEIVPDHSAEPSGPLPSKKSIKVINAMPDENQKQQRNHPKATSQENTSPAPVKRAKNKGPRQISSAKTHRPICKELPKVKSTGNMDAFHKEASPVTVRSVLEEEANNSKTRNRSRSGGRRPRSKSGSRHENRPRSKSGSRTEEGFRSRSVREIYYKIRTNTTNTIANINEQMSSTLQESIAHLNDICGKVRTTLTDMEKDEQTYKRLKSKQSLEVSSEGGGSTISVQTNKTAKENQPGEKIPIKTHTYTVITQPCQNNGIGQLMNTLSMGGDNLLTKSNGEIPPATPDKEKKKRKSRESKKRPTSKQRSAKSKTLTPAINSSKTKVGTVKKTISCDKTSLAKIPIWQRKPPSVIEEIQLTVKKQATKSQYREFLRALKSIARKQRSQVHVVPQEFREIVEKQQDKAFESISKHRLVTKRKKDAKPASITAASSPTNACKDCSPGKCTCGVTVENTITATNLQRSNWMHIRSDRKGIQVFDILDEITLKDVEPIQSEYPRKDHISDADASKRVQDTLLYKLLYHEDPKVLESLLKSNCQPMENHMHAPKVTVAKTERPKSVSDAYRLYEQLEFNADKKQLELNDDQKPSLKLTPTKGSICLKPSDNPKPKEKPKAVDTCMKDFDDELVIPDDLKPTMKHQVNPVKKICKKKYCQIKMKSDDDTSSVRSRKRIEDKLRIIGKKSSIRSIDRRSRRGKFSKENIRTRMKNCNVDHKCKIKNILTIMPISIVQNKDSLIRGKKLLKKEDVRKNDGQRDLKISAENMAKINSMSKREIVQILKPYIFYDLQPPVITVMPVYPKYNHQNKHQKQEHNANLSKAPTLKKVMGYLKDHDDDCHSGKKLCRRCQMFMQSGDETPRAVTKKFEPLSQKQLWKYKYRTTPSENLISRVLGKKTSRKKFQTVPPDESTSNQEVVITMTPRELNRNAANTRNKLNEVRNIMEDHKPLLGQHLDDIIDALEFRIVDALSNPKNQHSDAFSDIESEIKSILNTIGELKEEHIKGSSLKLKSKTDVDLEDSSDPSEMKSKTDINIISSVSKLLEDDTSTMRNNEKIAPILEEASHVIIEEEEPITEEEEELSQEKVDETYLSLGKDIEKVIDGLDAIMTIDEDNALKEEDAALKEEDATLKEEVVKVQQLKKNNLALESEDAMTTFCEQMDEVMKHLGSTDDLNASTDTLDAFPSEDIKERKSDEYLIPFMKAVKNYRRNEQSQSFLDFLDKLTMLAKETVPLTVYPRVPVYRATVKRSVQVVEYAKTYNQAVQCEELIADDFVDVDENFYDADASAVTLLSHAKEVTTKLPSQDDVLSTNQWMQTEEIQLYEEEFQEVKDCLIQTSSSDVHFHEDEEYLDTLDNVATSQKTLLISEKNTQIPSCLDHTCFAKSSSKDVQVTSELLEMTSETAANQTGESSEDDLMKTAISAECQVGSDFGDRNFTTAELDDNMMTAKYNEDVVATVDMASMEKYTNKADSCFDDVASEISFNGCPRTAYTDTYIIRDKNSLLESDLRLCDRPNSYPTTRRSSNIISLFESNNSSNDTNCTRDFLEDGFGKSPDNSYDSMLARCASSSETVAKAPYTGTMKEIPTNQIARISKQSKRDNTIDVKLVGQKNEEDDRHKNLLHSVYGIVFVLMFISINLNYGCYN